MSRKLSPSLNRVALGRGRITAQLGPTNTGKTHRAVQQMLRHRTGMLGLPLRLLAREVYDRVTREVGEAAAALITGEERRIPPSPRYFICTVESMPVSRPVDFLAVDEIQMAAHPDRGHVFTDRLLNARGVRETMFMGASTIGPLLAELVPEARVQTRPRLSNLRHAGPRRLGGLPRRSAVVAFSARDVYALAEALRGRFGGTAVVMGALSPRTRNAQVAMYQAGEVPVMVATDAIGMGLNMDIDHVAFAATRKFDGRRHRSLRDDELAQIAGRAGRSTRDGTFGTTAGAEALEREVAAAVEGHTFPALKHLWYRAGRPRYDSVDALRESLRAPPPRACLRRVRDAEDERALDALLADPQLRERAADPAAVELLWEICRVPDFRKTLTGDHARLQARLFRELIDRGRLDEDWLAASVGRLDRGDGDLDLLMTRLAWTRTWTYISFRAAWVPDPAHWQARTRAVEDRLSDALHERLTRRFVDRISTAMGPGRRLTGDDAALEGDAVTISGEPVGRLVGFNLVLDSTLRVKDQMAIRRAAPRVLAPGLAARVQALVEAPSDAFALDERARLTWRGAPLAQLAPGDSPAAPAAELLVTELLGPGARTRIEGRLAPWPQALVARATAPLRRPAASRLGPAGRRIVDALIPGLGAAWKAPLRAAIEELSARDRRRLNALEIRLGARVVYCAPTLKAAPMSARAVLVAVAERRPPPPPGGAPVSLSATPGHAADLWLALGYLPAGPLALRLDVWERVAARLRQAAREGPFAPPDAIMSWVGCGRDALPALVEGMGYAPVGGGRFTRARAGGRPRHPG